MKKIAVDAMGGDNAPQALVEGVNQAIRDFDDIEIVLYGDEAKIKDYLTATERVSIVHTEEKIDSDDEPTRAIRRKKQASMVLAAKDVKAGDVDAMLSAGNTGALLAAGFFIVGRIKGVERPGLMSTLPTVDGRGYDMLDLGANAENTPEHLHQYALMGSYYAENVRGIQLEEKRYSDILLVLDWATWRYNHPDGGIMPRSIQFRIHNRMIKAVNNESNMG